LGQTYTGIRAKLFRMIFSCWFSLLLYPLCFFLPSPGAAQSASSTNPAAQDQAADQISTNRVSAHELQIPPKAREAFNKGTELLAAKDSTSSIEEFQRAIKIFPEFYEAYYKIGLADLNLRDYVEAQAAFETSIDLSKGRYAPSQFGLGVALCAQKRFSEAEDAARAGLDQYPDDAAGHFTMAWILFTAHRLPEAEKSARQAVLYNANLATAYLLLAQIHLQLNDLSAVAADLDAYLRLDPTGSHGAEARAVRMQAQRVLAKQQRQSGGPVVAKTPNP
jgi:tetratricopeptide (TPR) repeat protein